MQTNIPDLMNRVPNLLRWTYRAALGSAVVFLSAAFPARSLAANQYVQHNLISDLPGIADQVDSNLTNPWGIALSETSPFWISNNHSGTTSVYDGQGHPAPTAKPILVQIPTPPGSGSASSPTGQVFNDTQGFPINGKPAVFVFATEDGTISGWSPSADPANAYLLIDNSQAGAVYKGLALATSSSGPRLYAANFSQGQIDVFDQDLAPVAVTGGFSDPNLPPGFAPFNIQRIGHKLYVTYAMQDEDKRDDVPGAGNGCVDIFDFDGNLLNRLIVNGSLNSPWGIAMAPSNFGDFSNALLVGNFGDGIINAFDSCSGEWLGSLQDRSGAVIVIPGLWALTFGNGRTGGDATSLYFTAGIPGPDDVEDHGLFGSIQTSATAPAAPQISPVNIANFAFAPQALAVAAGTQVQWTNQDGATHTITADDAQFNSGAVSRSQTFSQTFTTPGTYSYHCSIHPFMKGQITVK